MPHGGPANFEKEAAHAQQSSHGDCQPIIPQVRVAATPSCNRASIFQSCEQQRQFSENRFLQPAPPPLHMRKRELLLSALSIRDRVRVHALLRQRGAGCRRTDETRVHAVAEPGESAGRRSWGKRALGRRARESDTADRWPSEVQSREKKRSAERIVSRIASVRIQIQRSAACGERMFYEQYNTTAAKRLREQSTD